MATLESLNFDNLALCSLPTDKERNNSPREVKDVCFTLVNQSPVSNPRLVACSFDALALLDFQPLEASRPDFVEYFSGNKRLPGSETAAHCYCGFQSGYFSGQLGDGAAMYLGEIVNTRGERWEIQLKGAGVTPFSYTRDGRKVLRSSIREFLCSEAMHYLGVPTIRAGCCVTSDTVVLRDKDYSGIHVEERASLVLRISPTFIRFGSFEIFKPADSLTGYSGPSAGRIDLLHQLLEYTIKNFFPEVYRNHTDLEDRYLAFYKRVIQLTAQLVAQWQCVGFCHGVLNTDNMSIVGVTLDYGPFGFMDFYDPSYLSQVSDVCLRNSVKKQPEICKWDLLKLAEALQVVLPLEKSSAALEELFDAEFNRCFTTKIRRKLGLALELPTDTDLIQSLFDTMEKTAADFTNTFRCLSRISPTNCNVGQSDEDVLDYLVSQCVSIQELIKASSVTLELSQLLKFVRIAWKTRPTVVTHLEKEAEKYQIENERRKNKVERLKMSTQAQKEESDRKLWALWIKTYKARLDLEYDDQQNADEMNKERVKTMKTNNPRFILRNYITQRAIAAAEKGDFSVVQKIFKRLQTPYSDTDDESKEFTLTSPEAWNRSPCRQNDASGAYSEKTSNGWLNVCIT